MFSEPIQNLQWLGVTTMAIVAAAALAILFTRPLGRSTSISEHMAAGRWQYYTMGLALSLAGTAFYIFIIAWLGPSYAVGTWFYAVAIIGWAATCIVGWVPVDTEKLDIKHYIHMTTAVIAGLAMPGMIAFVLQAGTVSGTSLLLSYLMILVGITFLGFYALSRSFRKHILLYEIVYVAVFALTIISLTANSVT